MISLGPLLKDDAKIIATWRNKTQESLRTWKYTNKDCQDEWINNISKDNTCVYFSIYNDKTLIGYCGLDKIHMINRNAEISLLISPEHQKGGHGKSAVKLLLEYAFKSLGLNSIFGEVYDTTHAIEFWTKCGFNKTGEIPAAKWHNGKFYKSYIISMIKENFNELDS